MYYTGDLGSMHRLFLARQGGGKLDRAGASPAPTILEFCPNSVVRTCPVNYYLYFRRFAISSSVVPVVINSYNKAWPTLGRRIRPRRWIYSRLVLLPLTIIATRQSGTSTPSLSTRPVTSLV